MKIIAVNGSPRKGGNTDLPTSNIPAHCPDLFYSIGVITSAVVLLKKVCTIIIARRDSNLTLTGKSFIKNIKGKYLVIGGGRL
ncbi:hypothetical protein LCGC14_1324770 [marine sediment metagenome]|uniref:Uncharacterized protein n=1 Tax=marine sediment metagenome TaxID=412755 RepID=A0A0F9NKV5_9ZZZZ